MKQHTSDGALGRVQILINLCHLNHNVASLRLIPIYAQRGVLLGASHLRGQKVSASLKICLLFLRRFNPHHLHEISSADR